MKAEDVDPGLQPAKAGKRGGKKGIASLSDKHLMDKMGHALWEMGEAFRNLKRTGIPVKPPEGVWMWPGFSAEWANNAVAYHAGTLDRAFEEMEKRHGSG
jgi:hypothetical protein